MSKYFKLKEIGRFSRVSKSLNTIWGPFKNRFLLVRKDIFKLMVRRKQFALVSSLYDQKLELKIEPNSLLKMRLKPTDPIIEVVPFWYIVFIDPSQPVKLMDQLLNDDRLTLHLGIDQRLRFIALEMVIKAGHVQAASVLLDHPRIQAEKYEPEDMRTFVEAIVFTKFETGEIGMRSKLFAQMIRVYREKRMPAAFDLYFYLSEKEVDKMIETANLPQLRGIVQQYLKDNHWNCTLV